MLCNISSKKGVRKCERSSLVDSKVSEAGGEEGAPGTRAEIPTQPMVKTRVTQVVPLRPMEVPGGTDIHPAACGGPHAVAGRCTLNEASAHRDPMLEQGPERSCGLWRGGHTGAGFLEASVTLWEDPQWRSPFMKDSTLWKGPVMEQFMKNCNMLKGSLLEKVVKDCIPWEAPHTGSGEEYEVERPEEMRCNKLITTLIPHTPALVGWRRQ